MHNNSDFYQTDCRNTKYPLDTMYNDILKEINNIKNEFGFDYIFTHNPYGEYGHCDHKTCFDIVHNFTNYPIIITDIWDNGKLWPITKVNNRMKNNYYNTKIEDCKVNLNIYNECKKMYMNNKYKQNCWTHNRDPWSPCSLYIIK